MSFLAFQNDIEITLQKRKEKFSSTLFHVVNKFTTGGGFQRQSLRSLLSSLLDNAQQREIQSPRGPAANIKEKSGAMNLWFMACRLAAV